MGASCPREGGGRRRGLTRSGNRGGLDPREVVWEEGAEGAKDSEETKDEAHWVEERHEMESRQGAQGLGGKSRRPAFAGVRERPSKGSCSAKQSEMELLR